MKTDKNDDFVKDIKLSAGRIANRRTKERIRTYDIGIDYSDSSFSSKTIIGLEPVTQVYTSCHSTVCDFQYMGFCTCVYGKYFMEENIINFKGIETRKILDMKSIKNIIE